MRIWNSIKIAGLSLAITVTIAIFIALLIYDVINGREICGICNERIWSEGNQLYETWTCDRCWSEVRVELSEKYGNEFSVERIDDTYDLIKERSCALNTMYNTGGREL